MYIVVFYHDLVLRAGMNNETDYIIALIGTLLVIEGARRVVGWPMITIAILFVLYGLFGRMLPGIIAHRGLGLHELVNYLYYTTEGIFGTPMGVSSTFIYLFILFGAYLEATGLGNSLLIFPMPLQVGHPAARQSSGYLQCFGRYRIRQLCC